jgi:hypothetical protein
MRAFGTLGTGRLVRTEQAVLEREDSSRQGGGFTDPAPHVPEQHERLCHGGFAHAFCTRPPLARFQGLRLPVH